MNRTCLTCLTSAKGIPTPLETFVFRPLQKSFSRVESSVTELVRQVRHVLLMGLLK